MKKFVCFFIVMIGCAMVFQAPGFAQQTNMVLNFEGKNAQTGAAVQLETVYIKNLTKDCDTTLYGATPNIYLTWPSSIDELMGGKKSGFNISPNYPNPFSSSTSFELTVLERSSITIKLLDVYAAVHATFQQELDWGLHTFEVFTAINSIYFITVDNGITSRTIKMVSIGSADNQNQTIRYRGIENLKSGSVLNAFSFSPGDNLMMKATAVGFYENTMFHNPTENTSYTFELDPTSGEPPVADFTATPTSGTAPLTVNFNDQSANSPTSWQWDFGDGNSSEEQNPEHIYQNAGSYTVQLIVTNSHGFDTEIKTNYISVTTVGGTGQPCPGTPTVTDIDGNVYNTVLIGDQCWMKENLKTSKYRNETLIEYPGANNTAWENNTTGAYAWYDNDISWKDSYGALYNWYAVNNTSGLCPTGWHVPSEDELTQLVDYVVSQGYPNSSGDPNGASNALKSCRQVNSPLGGDCNTTVHPRWDPDDTHQGFDEFGFSGFPGGNRYTNGNFDRIGDIGYWWSSSEYSSERAWFRGMLYYRGHVGRYYYGKAHGFSVRCLRD